MGERLIDGAALGAVAALDHGSKALTIIGIDGGMLLGAGDGDIGDSGIDVGAERFKARRDQIARRPLRGMNVGYSGGTDVAILASVPVSSVCSQFVAANNAFGPTAT